MCISFLEALADALAPRRCAGCKAAGDSLCESCLELIDRIGMPAPAEVDGRSRLHAAFWYEPPLRQLIQSGKYGDHRPALHVAAVIASERLAGTVAPGDVLVPVPLGRRRRRMRGYNQAEVIAAGLAAAAGVWVQPDLARTRETPPQVGRHRKARAHNVHDAFAWRGSSLRGLRAWIVDDVVTTGATAAAAADALRIAEPRRVDVIALARA